MLTVEGEGATRALDRLPSSGRSLDPLPSAGLGSLVGSLIGAVGWAATANPFLMLAGAALGFLFGIIAGGVWRAPRRRWE